MQPVYLVIGVPGSGKTWVCKQLQDKFDYVPHDRYYKTIVTQLLSRSKEGNKPIITEVPFGERELRGKLEHAGITVHPYFVIEHPSIVQRRYFQREGKPLYKAAVTRSSTILNRANEWKAPHGKSSEILDLLKTL